MKWNNSQLEWERFASDIDNGEEKYYCIFLELKRCYAVEINMVLQEEKKWESYHLLKCMLMECDKNGGKIVLF